MTYCSDCIYHNVCGNEGVDNIAMTFCSDKQTDGDLISRQAVLDIFGDVHPLDYNNRAYVSMIKRLPSAEKTARWISVSERLPKYNKTVLVSVKQKGKEAMVFTAQRRRRVKTPDLFECCMDGDGWWDFRISAWDDHEVIAWMPLPEPYKESEEKNNGKIS